MSQLEGENLHRKVFYCTLWRLHRGPFLNQSKWITCKIYKRGPPSTIIKFCVEIGSAFGCGWWPERFSWFFFFVSSDTCRSAYIQRADYASVVWCVCVCVCKRSRADRRTVVVQCEPPVWAEWNLGQWGNRQARGSWPPHLAGLLQEQLGWSAEQAHPAGQEMLEEKGPVGSIVSQGSFVILFSIAHWHTFSSFDKNQPRARTNLSSSISSLLETQLLHSTSKHRQISRSSSPKGTNYATRNGALLQQRDVKPRDERLLREAFSVMFLVQQQAPKSPLAACGPERELRQLVQPLFSGPRTEIWLFFLSFFFFFTAAFLAASLPPEHGRERSRSEWHESPLIWLLVSVLLAAGLRTEDVFHCTDCKSPRWQCECDFWAA